MSCLLVVRDKNKKTDKMPKLGSLYKNTLYAKVTKVSQWYHNLDYLILLIYQLQKHGIL